MFIFEVWSQTARQLFEYEKTVCQFVTSFSPPTASGEVQFFDAEILAMG